MTQGAAVSTGSEVETAITDVGNVASALLPFVTLIAGFFPGAASAFALAEIVLKDIPLGTKLITTVGPLAAELAALPAFKDGLAKIAALLDSNDPAHQAYVAAVQSATEAGLVIDSPAALAQWPALAQRETIFAAL